MLEWDFDHIAGWSNGRTMLWISEANARGKKHRHRIGDVGFHHSPSNGAAGRTSTTFSFPEKKVKVVDRPAG